MIDSGTIGFIGLGNIGEAMTASLLRQGFHLVGYDVRPSAIFEAAGGEAVSSIAELVRRLPPDGAIFQSVPNEAALEATVNGLIDCGASNLTLIDISSYRLEAKCAAAARLADAGIRMLDCEVSGLPPLVAERKAIIFKSGDAKTIEDCKPLFDAIAVRHIDLGLFGAATRMKLIANTMVCVHNLMAAEALSLAAKAGIDPALAIEALGPSAAGSATFAMKAPLMASRDFAKGRGPFRHMFGYLARTGELAAAVEAGTPLLNAARSVYTVAEEERRHDTDIAAIIEIVERMPR